MFLSSTYCVVLNLVLLVKLINLDIVEATVSEETFGGGVAIEAAVHDAASLTESDMVTTTDAEKIFYLNDDANCMCNNTDGPQPPPHAVQRVNTNTTTSILLIGAHPPHTTTTITTTHGLTPTTVVDSSSSTIQTNSVASTIDLSETSTNGTINNYLSTDNSPLTSTTKCLYCILTITLLPQSDNYRLKGDFLEAFHSGAGDALTIHNGPRTNDPKLGHYPSSKYPQRGFNASGNSLTFILKRGGELDDLNNFNFKLNMTYCIKPCPSPSPSPSPTTPVTSPPTISPPDHTNPNGKVPPSPSLGLAYIIPSAVGGLALILIILTGTVVWCRQRVRITTEVIAGSRDEDNDRCNLIVHAADPAIA